LFAKIRRETQQPRRVVLQTAQRHIAGAAKQSPDCPSLVAVIYVQFVLAREVGRQMSTKLTATGAATVLCRKKPVVRIHVDPVLVAQDVALVPARIPHLACLSWRASPGRTSNNSYGYLPP
jgi:hypothetical protein